MHRVLLIPWIIILAACGSLSDRQRYDIREQGSLEVGMPAPDATLVSLDTGLPVQLLDFVRERPVVLVFGSYT